MCNNIFSIILKNKVAIVLDFKTYRYLFKQIERFRLNFGTLRVALEYPMEVQKNLIFLVSRSHNFHFLLIMWWKITILAVVMFKSGCHRKFCF